MYAYLSNKALSDIVNNIINTSVKEFSKQTASPIELDFFPRKQFDKMAIELYKTILTNENKKKLLPTKSTIVNNSMALLKHKNPYIYEELLSRNIDIYSVLIFNPYI